MAALKAMVLVVVVLVAGAGPLLARAKPQFVMNDNLRIFGGDFASENEFPGQVYVLTTARDEITGRVMSIFCGGTIISEAWVVTAAHCLDGSANTVVLGGSSDINDMESIRAKRVIQHENYRLYGRNDNNAVNDIGLVELSRPFKLNGRTFRRISLPTYGEKLKLNSGVVVVGWGRWTYDPSAAFVDDWSSAKLKKLPVKVIPCPVVYNDTKVICIQSAAGTGICDGDSGGPLLMNNVVYGVASFVDNINPDPTLDPNLHCDEKGTWAVFMALASFRPWIHEQTNI